MPYVQVVNSLRCYPNRGRLPADVSANMTLKAFGGPMDVVIEYEIVCSEEVYCRVAADIDGVPAGAWEVGPVRITTAGDRVRERFRIEKVGPGAVAGIIEVHAVIRDAGDRSPLDSSVAMFEIVEGTS